MKMNQENMLKVNNLVPIFRGPSGYSIRRTLSFRWQFEVLKFKDDVRNQLISDSSVEKNVK